MTLTVSGDTVLAVACQWIGTPYRHGASARGVGCDCLGLVRGIWREVVGPEPAGLPPYTRDFGEIGGHEFVLAGAGRHLVRVNTGEPTPGDVLVFRWRARAIAKHIGIYAGHERLIHAWERGGVCLVHMGIWSQRIAARFRFPAHNG